MVFNKKSIITVAMIAMVGQQANATSLARFARLIGRSPKEVAEVIGRSTARGNISSKDMARVKAHFNCRTESFSSMPNLPYYWVADTTPLSAKLAQAARELSTKGMQHVNNAKTIATEYSNNAVAKFGAQAQNTKKMLDAVSGRAWSTANQFAKEASEKSVRIADKTRSQAIELGRNVKAKTDTLSASEVYGSALGTTVLGLSLAGIVNANKIKSELAAKEAQRLAKLEANKEWATTVAQPETVNGLANVTLADLKAEQAKRDHIADVVARGKARAAKNRADRAAKAKAAAETRKVEEVNSYTYKIPGTGYQLNGRTAVERVSNAKDTVAQYGSAAKSWISGWF